MKWFFRWFQKGLNNAARESVNNVPPQLTVVKDHEEDLGRDHSFSSSSLRKRVAEAERTKK